MKENGRQKWREGDEEIGVDDENKKGSKQEDNEGE